MHKTAVELVPLSYRYMKVEDFLDGNPTNAHNIILPYKHIHVHGFFYIICMVTLKFRAYSFLAHNEPTLSK